MRWRKAAVVVVGAVLVAEGLVAGSAAAGRKPAKPGDFNGDGRVDLVAGHPGLTVKGRKRAGGVVVIDGARKPGTRWRTLTRDTAGVPDRSRSKERFGAALASGDFDRDGYADLAVSAGGKVVVLHGTAGGLTGRRARQIAPGFPANQDGPGSAKGRPDSRRFGTVLTSGDYNGDGYADLAVRSDRGEAGLLVLKGGRNGLTTKGARRLTNGLKRFGTFLGSADVTGDGVTDLVASQETPDGLPRPAGAVVDQPFTLVPGSRAGLRMAAAVRWSAPAARALRFGLGDLTGDGRADLVRADAPSADAPGGFATQVSEGGAFGTPRVTSLGGDIAASGAFAIGDVTGDGRGDLLAGLWAFAAFTALYPGAATGVGPRLRAYGGDSEAVRYGDHVAVADVAGNRRADVLYTATGGYGDAAVSLHTAGAAARRTVFRASGAPEGFTLLSP
ncbi:VCBS repeat-containing protein [Actinocorallia sp. API 0066]|uniref:FG-GAP repeat domain-containing protein n=1 Tax=Actinocorallia sp. API 0066 TaxID=2896846 RepID=UPI001E358EA3|nr:VCBS repeat-containing protein [Actinocorallia sp. API 0066]MCD0447988.1 VCBS repeat-containing protein [Actinocorallia sp. API 0066]